MIHVVVYFLLSTTELSFETLCFYGFWAKVGSGLGGAMTSYVLIQRSKLEPLHRQGYLAMTWGIMDSLGSMAGYIFIELVYDNKLGWFKGDPQRFFSLNLLCFLYALYPLVLVPFYLMLAEPTVRVAKRVCREIGTLEHQLREADVFFLCVLMIVLNLMNVSAGDTSMFKIDGCEIGSAV